MGPNTIPRLRKFRLEDLPAILEIEAGASPKTPLPEMSLVYFSRRSPETFVVAEIEGIIAGYMIFDRLGHVHSTAVRPGFRRRGLGREMFEYARERSPAGLWLEVRLQNTGAIAFYMSLGMKAAGLKTGYYGDDDALMMETGGGWTGTRHPADL